MLTLSLSLVLVFHLSSSFKLFFVDDFFKEGFETNIFRPGEMVDIEVCGDFAGEASTPGGGVKSLGNINISEAGVREWYFHEM